MDVAAQGAERSNHTVAGRWPEKEGRTPIILLGIFAVLFGAALVFSGAVLEGLHRIVNRAAAQGDFPLALLLAGLVLTATGALLVLFDLVVLLPRKRCKRYVSYDEILNKKLTVVLTAYNDELSIGAVTQEFLAHPLVSKVIVVDNNSKDKTAAMAAEAGAQVIVEAEQGYGRCVYRALKEGSAQSDTQLTLLCEGDGTFSAFDIDKFMAYIAHAGIVSGTRIVEQLRDRETQLTTFMYYGNFVVGKLLELKHLGCATFTDVGTTYKLCRNEDLHQLLPHLDARINLEFNAYFLDKALTSGVSIVECPVTFHKRVGISKGGNRNDFRALQVGLTMIRGILFSW